MDTQLFFIVSSGRSGTQAMEKLLAACPEVEMHHEYLCTHVQPLAVRHYLGLTTLAESCAELMQLHGAAAHYCQRPLFGDSSNKLAWLIQPLIRIFPQAKFIHLVRDGRKVVSSFYNKLADECYDDHSTAILQNWYDNPANHPPPPPEKKYWWNVPRRGSELAEPFRRFDQFQRICFHWREVNRVILNDLACVPPQQQRRYRLEDLTTQPALLDELFDFIGLPPPPPDALRRPHNVNRPINFSLNERQKQQFWAIAADMMDEFGYSGTPEYEVVYDPDQPRESNQ